ncbi:hypothetical protein ACFSO7_02490 [Bacillus sp. CGMCC 1.16607]|uniref:hypothetical protein n=1 Tax=Bacillus sp. CGMCC 1.16607 TaxID=3351842 RepID=UPI0036387879
MKKLRILFLSILLVCISATSTFASDDPERDMQITGAQLQSSQSELAMVMLGTNYMDYKNATNFSIVTINPLTLGNGLVNSNVIIMNEQGKLFDSSWNHALVPAFGSDKLSKHTYKFIITYDNESRFAGSFKMNDKLLMRYTITLSPNGKYTIKSEPLAGEETVKAPTTPKKPATTNSIVLSSKDVTLMGISLNENINNMVGRFKKTYKNIPIEPFSHNGETSYLSGDPTPAMAYFLGVDYDTKKRVIGVDYQHFKSEKKGFNVVTSRGIKPGSSISQVYKQYGKKVKISRDKDPGWNYVELTYNISIKETKQTGTLTFMTRYSKKQKEADAKVMGIEYKVTPIK